MSLSVFGKYPDYRPRRLRQSPAFRRLLRETELDPGKLILPLFVLHGNKLREPVSSMPGVFQMSPDEALVQARAAFQARADRLSFSIGPNDNYHFDQTPPTLAADALKCGAVRAPFAGVEILLGPRQGEAPLQPAAKEEGEGQEVDRDRGQAGQKQVVEEVGQRKSMEALAQDDVDRIADRQGHGGQPGA